jgi:hypothetical protein
MRPCGRRALGRVVCWEFAAAAAATLARRLNSGSSRSWVASMVALAQRARRYRGLRGRVGGSGYEQAMVESITKRVSVGARGVRWVLSAQPFCHSAHV